MEEFAMAREFQEHQVDNSCPSIIEYQYVHHEAGGGSYIILPLLGKDLEDAGLSRDQAPILMKDLLKACHHFHYNMKRVHGDLHSMNVMTTPENTENTRFVVIDVLSPRPHNLFYIIKDLRQMKDLPQLCFKAEVKQVSEEIEKLVKEGGKAVPRSITTHFSYRMFTGKIINKTITVSSFRRLVRDLAKNDWLKNLNEELLTRAQILTRSIERSFRISEYIEERCTEVLTMRVGSMTGDTTIANQIEVASKIAQHVLKELPNLFEPHSERRRLCRSELNL